MTTHQAIINSFLGRVSMPVSTTDDGLDYHRREGELRVIKSAVERLLDVWKTREAKYMEILKDTLVKFSQGDYSNLSESCPAYIKKLIENPRGVHSSLHKDISIEMIRNLIKDSMERTL